MNNGITSPTYAFLVEISPNGDDMVYSTFFGSATTNCNGGSICIGAVGVTSANAIAIDDTGAVVIGGYTTANLLPVTPGTLGQQCNCDRYRRDAPFVQSGFLAKFAARGKATRLGDLHPTCTTQSRIGVRVLINYVRRD